MPRRKRALVEADPNASDAPPKKNAKTSPAEPPKQPTTVAKRNYRELNKSDLIKEVVSRDMMKSGTSSALIARLEEADAARAMKYAAAARRTKDGPISKEAAAEQPVGAKRKPSRNPGPTFRSSSLTEKNLRRGANGPAVYDRMGFELDHEKAAGIVMGGFGCRTKSFKAYEEMLDRDHREGNRKAEIMGTERNQVSALTHEAWDDRVSRDLGIPYHQVQMEDFEEWHRRGFRGEAGEFEAVNIPEKERKRLQDLTIGSAFRK